MKGQKTGGRKKGSRNKLTTEMGETVKGLFEKLGGPGGEQYAEQLHNLAALPHDDPHVRLKALAVIAPYIWGKPVDTVDLKAAITGTTTVVHKHG